MTGMIRKSAAESAEALTRTEMYERTSNAAIMRELELIKVELFEQRRLLDAILPTLERIKKR